MSGTWADWREPSRVPDESLPMFGAQIGHDPSRESAAYSSCPRCGGAQRDRVGRVTPNRAPADDPVRTYAAGVTTRGVAILAPVEFVCGCCGRAAHDGSSAMSRAVKPGSGEYREGFESLGSANEDREHRTEAAVEGAAPDRPMTRKAKRALKYGHRPPADPAPHSPPGDP
jgi:hypothetical protein